MIDTWDGRVLSAWPAVRIAVRNFLSMASLASLIFAAMLFSAPPAHAQTVTTAFNLDTNFPGYEIDAIAVNTETNKIYIATQNISGAANSGRIFVLDGSTNKTLTSFSDTSTDADQPFAIAINPVTNMIYVANTGGGASGGSVTVINGATDTIVTTMRDGNSLAPQALVVNPLTNIIYVANNSSGNVTMYSGATNTSLGTFGVGTGPVALALNTAASPALLYVVNSGVVGGNTINSGSIQVVDTTHTNTPTTVTDPAATNPIAVAVDVVSGLAYVAENTPASLTVISGSSYMTNIKDTGAASTPRSVAVNPLTHRVYVADVGGGSGTVSIFQGTTYQATITMTDGPNVVAVDTSTDIAYAVDDAGHIAVINGATGTAFSPVLQTSAGLEVVAVNPVTHRAYVAIDNEGNEVSMAIVDGATNATTSIGVESEPWAVAVNPATNMIYVANFDDDDVSVINGATNQVVADPSTGEGPDALVVDPVNNLIYVANFDSSSLTVINGATNGTASLSFDTTPITPDSLAINPVLNEVYGASSGSNLGFSFPSSFASQSVFDSGFVFGGATPLATAANPATGAHFTLLQTGSGSPFLVVDDLTAPQGFYYRPCGASAPITMDVNPTANSVFIPCTDGTINVLQGMDVFGDGPATIIPAPSGYTGPYSAVAANPITNMAYVADSGNSNLYVINGANNTVTATVTVGANPTSIAVNIASNKIYVLSVVTGSAPSLTIVDGLTNTVLGTIPVGTTGQVAARNYELAANPATGNIYGLNLGGDNAQVITENTPAIACNPSACLTTTIQTFDNNTVFTSLPTFGFTAQNHLTGAPVTGVYFQVDTWQGVWNPTTLNSGVYTPKFPLATPIPPGFHMLYAFATSGDDANTSSFVGLQASPLVGPIASYGFLVAPPIAGAQQNLFFGTVAVGASGGTQTAFLANNGAATLTYSYTITGPNANDFVPNGTGNQPCDNSGQVLAVSYCALSIDFVPSTVASESAILTWTDNSLATGTNVTQVVNLTGIGANVTAPTILTGPANPTSSTSATFTFNDSDPGVTSFTCQLDNLAAASCVSGVTYNSLAATSHTFTVYGTASGVNSPTSTYNWTITGSTFSPFNLSLIGFGGGTVTGGNNIFCQEAAGLTTGDCSTVVTNGNSEMLSATPANDGSQFGGWGGDAASCGMNLTCSVLVSTTTNAIASFVSGPATINVSFTPSTTPQTQEAIFDCPSNTNPCTDPNAHALALSVPAVSTGFTMSIVAHEISPFQANGDCASGNTVLTDFDCRFVSFFTFGPDGSGGEVVPLCDPYSNGNCIYYTAEYCVPQVSGPCVSTPGAEPPATFYQSPVNWTITWNDDTFVPPSPYQATPRLYDDPDTQVNNTDPYGTNCVTPMQINGLPTVPPIFCQFVYDITTTFNPGAVVDSGIGGTTRQFNDVVVAFPVTLNPAFVNAADAPTVDAFGTIGFTNTVTAPATNGINNVTLNDPLPAGPGTPVTWVISPPYSGPGTCSLGGLAGSQVLSCSFGNLSASQMVSVGVTAANSPAGLYLNASTVTSNNGSLQNQTLLSIATVNVQLLPSAFGGLSGSQSGTFGAPVTLSGTISANDPVYPPTTESVSISIAGVTQQAAIGALGAFKSTFTNIPASTTPYVITYRYAGDANFAPVTNTSTTLTVGKANSTTTITSNTPNPSTTSQVVTVGFKVAGVSGATVPTGSVTITAKLSSTTVTCSGTLTSGAGSCQFTLSTGGAWTLTASYGGDTNYNGGVSGGTSQTVSTPGSMLKFSPPALNFGTVYVGTTEILTMSITNTGSSMVTFSSFSIASISGDDSSGFLGIAFCPKTLNPEKSCTIIMSFTADSNVTKAHAANLVMVDNGAGSPQMVLMSATVINPVASLNPSSLSFGNQKTGTTSASKTITLTNTGTTALTLSTVSISGNFALASGTTCAHGTTLAPSAPCLIKVTFTPTSKGSKSGTVTVSDNALRGTSTASLSGTGN
jgi:YVTN family beta-propeller protein